MNKYVAAVILYHPDKEVFARIDRYSKIFDKVIVYDNTENPEYHTENSDKITYLGRNKNDGLPYAYNKILKYIFDNYSFDYMCMLDQDSEYSNTAIKNIINFIENSKMKNVAIYGPAIKYRYHTPLTKNKFDIVSWVITSGCFVNLKIIKDNGLSFDENYFIDRFEVDMCKQLTNLNYKIVQVNSSIIKKELGEDSGHRHPNHSPIRHYYLARNRLYFNKKYYGFLKRWLLNILQSGRHIVLIALYENNKASKIKHCLKGWNDYSKSKFKKA